MFPDASARMPAGAKVVGVIPARWGSTRLPGKMLVRLCGRPMIEWVLRSVGEARLLDAVVVATDDGRIVEAVERAGGIAVMTSPSHPSGTDRAAEAVAGCGAAVVINIQGDEPLVDPALVDELARAMLADPSLDMATAASRIENDEDMKSPAVVKVVCAANGLAMYFSRHSIPYVRDPEAGLDALHWRHIGIYAYRRAFLERLVAEPPCLLERAEKLEQLRALHLGARMKVLPWRKGGVGVDTPADVARAEEALRRRWPELAAERGGEEKP